MMLRVERTRLACWRRRLAVAYFFAPLLCSVYDDWLHCLQEKNRSASRRTRHASRVRSHTKTHPVRLSGRDRGLRFAL